MKVILETERLVPSAYLFLQWVWSWGDEGVALGVVCWVLVSEVRWVGPSGLESPVLWERDCSLGVSGWNPVPVTPPSLLLSYSHLKGYVMEGGGGGE